jgi:protein O-GlcNAc transferase
MPYESGKLLAATRPTGRFRFPPNRYNSAMPDVNELIRTAVARHQAGRLEEADAIYAQVLKIDRNHVDALHLSGLIAHQRGRVIDAVDRVGRAVRLRPAEPGFWFNFGNVLAAAGRDADAADAFRTAAGLKPGFVDAMSNLANALDRLKRDAELLEVRKKIAAAKPADAEAHLKLAQLHHRLKQLGPAVTEYQHVIRLSPNLTVAYQNLAPALQGLGRTAEAMAVFEKLVPPDDAAVKISPAVHSNLMLAMLYGDTSKPAEILDAHKRWARIHIPKNAGSEVLRRPGPGGTRRIKIGYVSADFWDHPVGHFIRPLIERFDREQFDVICYDHSERDDRITSLLRNAATAWRPSHTTTDGQLAAQIREDQIDILVDLSGHTAGHRLTTFALRPAPIQMTYLGYPATTGVPAIDYRITDTTADPAGMTDTHYTEQLIRLPGCFLCYTPPADAPPVAALPAESNGFVTFGSFNAASKISPTTVRLWAAVLNAVPKSRLVLKAVGWMEAENQCRLTGEFAAAGVDSARIEFLPADEGWFTHMTRYGRLDLALDPLPYHGTTTTCDALWMGVPTITLAGTTHVSRVGATLMKHAGIGEFVASNESEFMRIACEWAGDVGRLRKVRASLRDRVRASTLCDSTAFVQKVEKEFLRHASRV